MDLFRVVGREVVDYHVDVAIGGLSSRQFTEVADELLARVPVPRPGEDFSRERVERGVERERPVAVVLEAVPLQPSGRQRQKRVEPVEGLDGRLLVEAEDRCVLLRIDVEPDDVGGLLLELRVMSLS
jgi:hypothetical protein